MKGLLFTYLMTYGGAAISLVRPIYGLCIYISFAILKPDLLWAATVPLGNYSRVIGIALLVGWMLHGCGGFRLGRALVPALAILGFWFFSGISAMLAGHQEPAWHYMDIITKIAIPCFVGITLINTKEDLALVAGSMVASTGYLALHHNEMYLAYGLAEGDNMIAHTMAAVLPMLVFFAMSSQQWWLKGVCYAAAALSLHTVLFNMSRGAFLGVAASACVGFVIIKKTPQFYLFCVLASLVVLRMAGPTVWEEMNSMFVESEQLDDSATSRFVFWKSMFQSTMENPLFGVGPENWRHVSWKYNIPGREGHGMWLQLACEIGIPGFLCIALYYFGTAWRLLPAALGRHAPEQEFMRPYAQMYVAGIAAWAVCEIFGSFYFIEFPYYLGLLGAGTLKVAATIPVMQKQGVPVATTPVAVPQVVTGFSSKPSMS
jgi:O-antigen ligase